MKKTEDKAAYDRQYYKDNRDEILANQKQQRDTIKRGKQKEQIYRDMPEAQIKRIINSIVKESSSIVGLLGTKELREIAYKEYLPTVIEKHMRI